MNNVPLLKNASLALNRKGYCQAQPKLQVKFSLKAELALFSVYPTTHPHPPTGKVSVKAYFKYATQLYPNTLYFDNNLKV